MSAVHGHEHETPAPTRPSWVSDDALANLIETQRRAFRGGLRRVVVRLVDGEELEVGRVRDRDEGLRLARETSERVRAAVAAGVWPELEGRHLRPDAIVSIDVQRVD